jgi:prepilin-type N-terminal cleavage/methylation domain-containing protein
MTVGRARHDRGFSLWELLILVAIGGILAAIAIPANCDYMARSRVAIALRLSEPHRQAIERFYLARGFLPVRPTELAADWPQQPIDPSLSAVRRLTLGPGGRLELVFDGDKVSAPWNWGERTLVLTPTRIAGQLRWEKCRQGNLFWRLRGSDCEQGAAAYLPLTDSGAEPAPARHGTSE